MRGRHPKPTALKVLEGRSHRPLPGNEPKPAQGVPSCPKHLNSEARKEWRRITKELLHLGLLTKIDRGALSCYCQAWARLIEAEEYLAKEGVVIDGRQAGLVKNPW